MVFKDDHYPGWTPESDKERAGPSHFKISFKKREYEDRWTRYRAKVLEKIGLSDYEIEELKFNRMTNPRVAWFLKDIRQEVKTIGEKFGLPSYEAAAQFRRDHFEDLIDSGDIEESDPYIRMGYME